jgi:hypothetical protein
MSSTSHAAVVVEIKTTIEDPTTFVLTNAESVEEIAGALIALHDRNKLRGIVEFLHRYPNPQSTADWLPRAALRSAFRHEQEQEKAAAARCRIDRVRAASGGGK